MAVAHVGMLVCPNLGPKPVGKTRSDGAVEPMGDGKYSVKHPC